jgi:RNA-splicing ligase RtcB
MEFCGKFTSGKVFADVVEKTAMDQVRDILDSPAFADKKIRFMPDIHAGVGVPIGFTAELGDKIIPNVVGVDIGCGVTCFNMGPIILKENDFKELDRFIRTNIPFGLKARKTAKFDLIEYTTQYLDIKYRPVDFDNMDKKLCEKYTKDSPFMAEVREICNITKQDFNYAMCSLGTLGGGNHFCSVDEDPLELRWKRMETEISSKS